MGLVVFFDPSPPSPLLSNGRGGIEGDFREDRENFNAIGRLPGTVPAVANTGGN